jgi:DNA-directed RNA polymerase specialized sigma24 family protein
VKRDPLLRACYAVLAAPTSMANEAVRDLRDLWYPFHLLHENQRKRLQWMEALQQATGKEAAEAGWDEERTSALLESQGLWAAVIRSPIKFTGDAAWREIRKSLAADEMGNPYGRQADLQKLGVEVSHKRELADAGPREVAATRLLVYESLVSAAVAHLAAQELSDAQQKALQFTYIGGLMEREVAVQMLMSEEAVAQLKRRALAIIRKAAAHPQL